MSKLTKYRVVRPHEGDRSYAEGDMREAHAADVKHLVPTVLMPVGPDDQVVEAKAEPPLKNKAKGAAPANKAE